VGQNMVGVVSNCVKVPMLSIIQEIQSLIK
jgi:hypothetical protein